MGLDYGSKRVGVALSFGDALAEPETILTNDSHLFSRLATTIQEHHVQKIVLGVTDGSMQSAITQFQHSLTQQFHLPVELMDEAFSSSEAAQKTSSTHLDDKAAAIILQNYLDIHRAPAT